MVVGKWDNRYAGLVEPEPYGDELTYRLGAMYLWDCAVVEDWGCGAGWLRRLVPPGRYRGVDGSHSRFADVVADLRTYTSDADGIFIRHVLEHNLDWERILGNAVASFRKKLVLILFTPLAAATHVASYCPDIGVPDLAFSERDIVGRFERLRWRSATVESETHYGAETIFYVRR